MQHADRLPRTSAWRAATFVVAVVAVCELFALLVLAGVRFAPAAHKAAAVAAEPAAEPKPTFEKAPAAPLRPRDRVRVLVLNGNGVSGAASAAASRLQVEGYRIGGSANAKRHDYAQSLVMYAPGWAKEARRLAHDAGVRLVGPLDGVRPAELRGSKVVLLLGT